MEEKQSTFRLSGREKAGLIWHYLRPCWGHFAAALLCACLSMALNALTPQIIRITVDSILGSEEAKLPVLVLRRRCGRSLSRRYGGRREPSW